MSLAKTILYLQNQIRYAVPNVSFERLLNHISLQPDTTPHDQISHLTNFLIHIQDHDITKENHLLKFHKDIRYSKMSVPKKQQVLSYAHEADLLLREALPFTFNQTRYLHLLPPSKQNSGYFDFSNFIRLGIVKGIAYEKEGVFATYFHENGHMMHYTATESPFVDFQTAEKNHALFKQLLEDAYTSQTFKQLKSLYPASDFLTYITSEPEIIARMIESYCLHYHDLADKTEKNRMPYWQFTKEEVQHVPHLLKEIYDTKRNIVNKPSILTLYLDFDGVLVTKFSQGTSFDLICVHLLRKILFFCKKQYETFHLCIISNWRFEKTAEEITSLLNNHALLEHVDQLIIPTDVINREQQILQHQNQGHFLILDDQPFQHRYLINHHIQLRAEDGLRGLDMRDIASFITF